MSARWIKFVGRHRDRRKAKRQKCPLSNSRAVALTCLQPRCATLGPAKHSYLGLFMKFQRPWQCSLPPFFTGQLRAPWDQRPSANMRRYGQKQRHPSATQTLVNRCLTASGMCLRQHRLAVHLCDKAQAALSRRFTLMVEIFLNPVKPGQGTNNFGISPLLRRSARPPALASPRPGANRPLCEGSLSMGYAGARCSSEQATDGN